MSTEGKVGKERSTNKEDSTNGAYRNYSRQKRDKEGEDGVERRRGEGKESPTVVLRQASDLSALPAWHARISYSATDPTHEHPTALLFLDAHSITYAKRCIPQRISSLSHYDTSAPALGLAHTLYQQIQIQKLEHCQYIDDTIPLN